MFHNEKLILSNSLRLGYDNPLSKIILSYVFCLPKSVKESETFKQKYCINLKHFIGKCALCTQKRSIYFHLDQDNNFIINMDKIDYINSTSTKYDYLICIYCMFKIFTSFQHPELYPYRIDVEYSLDYTGDDYKNLVSRFMPFAKFNTNIRDSDSLSNCNSCYIENNKMKCRTTRIERTKNEKEKEESSQFHQSTIALYGSEISTSIQDFICSLCRNRNIYYQLIHCNGVDVTHNKYYNFEANNWMIICVACSPRPDNLTWTMTTRGANIYDTTDIKKFLSIQEIANKPIDPLLLFLYNFCKNILLPGKIVYHQNRYSYL
jgi:hypothetical protein